MKPLSPKNKHPDASNILSFGQLFPNACKVKSVKCLQFEMHRNCKLWQLLANAVKLSSVKFFKKIKHA